ncbi:MAG: LON peptidase substrate-binding domain-containing protein [Actinobacteria bacterium]|nr:LON peptidase substrate-binding domain-containing protein [Actinomycetota bacterium]
MFPLGTVLLPGAFLPLQVFEPRYQAMLSDLLAGSRCFGTVLIERGSEVGGGEVRTDVGTIARIVEARTVGDDRWSVAVTGMQRIQVMRWLPDDPYPMALVADLPDVEQADRDIGRESARLAEVAARLRVVLADLGRLGDPVPADTFECSGDPAVGTFQLGSLGPFGPLDRQRLLAATRTIDRLVLLEECLTHVEEVVAYRLGG